MEKNIKILVCPLDWGLGHATRCIPIIHQLLSKNIQVYIGGHGNSFSLLKNEFPQLEFVLMEGLSVKYPQKGSMALKMFFHLPSIFANIIKEHRLLSRIIKKHQIDAIISDNRYGLFSNKVPSVFITHQLMVKFPLWLKIFEPFLYLLNNFFISRYYECWVPDYSGKINLSANLSHKYPRLSHVLFIGPLSRFYNIPAISETTNPLYDLMVVISGPEPQRSILEDMVFHQLKNLPIKAIIIKGMPTDKEIIQNRENLTIFSCLNSQDLLKYMSLSRVILCRSGYSSIMDLCALGKKAILIPTPGQTEQEYLATCFKNKKIFFSQTQKRLNICDALKESEQYEGIKIKNNVSLLNKRIDHLLVKIREKK